VQDQFAFAIRFVLLLLNRVMNNHLRNMRVKRPREHTRVHFPSVVYHVRVPSTPIIANEVMEKNHGAVSLSMLLLLLWWWWSSSSADVVCTS
jgi:hypothetical protein